MQVHDLQEDALIRSGVLPENIYKDIISGKSTSRKGLDECMAQLKPGDTLVVWKLDRLGRSVNHLKRIVEDLHDRGINFESLKEKIDTGSAIGKFFFHMMAALAEFERDMISERVSAGMAAAKARGQKLGPEPEHEDKYLEILSMLDDGLSQRDVADRLGVSKTTVQRVNAKRDLIEVVPEMS